MGLQARLIGKFVRKTTQALLFERKRDHLSHLMFLNQFRMKVGLVFGDPRSLPGGKALEFATSQQIEAKNKEHLWTTGENKDLVQYNEHTIKITKNKTGGPFKESLYRLIRTPHDGMPETFINQAGAIHSFGSKIGVVDGTLASFTVDGIPHKFKGAPGFNAWAMENEAAYYGVVSKIVAGYRNKWGLDG
jgi:RecA/RadA recombinase